MNIKVDRQIPYHLVEEIVRCSDLLGLSMIVKDEMNRVEDFKKCLESIVDYLDYWVICDAGSTDGTQEWIRKFFRERRIEGQLIEKKSGNNPSYYRNCTLEIAQDKTVYLILSESDGMITIKDPNFKWKLKSSAYMIKYEGFDYWNTLLIQGKYKWECKGITHEYIFPKLESVLATPTNMLTIRVYKSN